MRAGVSVFALLDGDHLASGLRRLDADLRSGAWHERHADLAGLDALDVGIDLVLAELGG